MSTILIAEHNPPLRELLTTSFREHSYEVTEAHDGAEAIAKLDQHLFDVILTELYLPEKSGIDVLQASQRCDDLAPVLVLAGAEEVSLATEALRLGAEDYLLKQSPFNLAEAHIRAERARDRRHRMRTMQYLQGVQPYICECEAIVKRHSHWQNILARLQRHIVTNAPVLISGETGTGKALLAAAIHANSPRRSETFVTVNCAAGPDWLIEGELFGYEKDAFPGADRRRLGHLEHAHMGTLFLHQVDDLSARTQMKILRVLQDRTFERLGSGRLVNVDVRLIVASARHLTQHPRPSQLRGGVWPGLRAIRIEMPALRECRDDILPLAHFFRERYNRVFARHIEDFDPAAQRGLLQYSWPGNLRELEHTIARGVLLEEGAQIRLSSLGLDDQLLARAPREGHMVRLPPHGGDLKEIERQALLQALERANWVQKRAAAQLDITPRVMHYKLKSHGITHPRWTKRR